MQLRLKLSMGLLWTLAIAPLMVQTAASAGAEDARVVNEFKVRAEQYVHFREKAGPAPKTSNAPEAIVARQRQLAEKVRVARVSAKQGEIFTPEIAQYFRRQIAASLRGPHGKEIVASLHHAEPVKIELQINQSYPDNIPLQSTPPTLLLILPNLPDGLEYRIVNRQLVLRDTEANIVVDYIPNALPEATK
jgi:hypothetical protein